MYCIISNVFEYHKRGFRDTVTSMNSDFLWKVQKKIKKFRQDAVEGQIADP
jgi:hypothetical protein